MNKSSVDFIGIEKQRHAWNKWHRSTRPGNYRYVREWERIDRLLAGLGRIDLRILEVGCGSGWLSERLLQYGHVTATDLSVETIIEAQTRFPSIHFMGGDFFAIDFGRRRFDVIVTQHVLSHVADQDAFMAKISHLLVPHGTAVIATQNRPVLERWSIVPGPYPGQLRHWLSASELRHLLNPHFRKVTIESILPAGDQGYLRLVNSPRLNGLLHAFVNQPRVERWKEKAMLGQTLLAYASVT